MLKQQSAGVITYFFQDNEREYLLLQYAAGHFDFPKGHLEKNESFKDAALRELKEETGLTLEILPAFIEKIEYKFRDSYSKELITKTVSFFLGEALTKEVTLSHEHIAFEWLPYKEAIKKISFKNARETLMRAEQFLSNNPRGK